MSFDNPARLQLEIPELSFFNSTEAPETVRPARPAKKGNSTRGKPLPPLDANQLAAAQAIARATDSKDTLRVGEEGVAKAAPESGAARPVVYVDATAGAGKTTVIMQALGEMGRHSGLLLTTFGTAPTKTLERRAKLHHPDLALNNSLVFNVRTINSLGLRLLNSALNLTHYGKAEEGKTPEPSKLPGQERELRSLYNDPAKYADLAKSAAQAREIQQMLPATQTEQGPKPDFAPFQDLVSFCLTGLIKDPEPADLRKVISDHRLSIAEGAPTNEQLTLLCKAISKIQEKGREALFTETEVERKDGGIDVYVGRTSFIDQVWMPFFMDLQPRESLKARAVVVDEYQDLSPAQLGIINRYMHPDTPLVMVGDRRQAIFGFNGAGGRAFDLMAHHFPGERIALNDSYRCPESHLAIARHYHPYVRRAAAAGHDPLGSGVWHIDTNEMLDLLEPGDVVLGRSNAALVAAGLRYALKSGFDSKTGKPNGCRIVVKGLRGALLRTISDVSSVWRKKKGAKRINFRTEFRKALQLYGDNLPKGANPDDLALLNVLYEHAHDRPEGATSEKFASHCAKVLTVEDPLVNRSKVIEFRSVHSMKGDENDRIFVVGLGMGPDSPAWPHMSPLQQQEELNINYVALTRGKRELYLVEGFHNSMAVAGHLVTNPIKRPED